MVSGNDHSIIAELQSIEQRKNYKIGKQTDILDQVRAWFELHEEVMRGLYVRHRNQCVFLIWFWPC